jgi:hypothetical protein
MKTGKTALWFLIAFAVTAGLILTQAVPAEAYDGILGCGGSTLMLVSNDETYTVYHFRNYNDAAAIRIERMMVYNDEGALLCDFGTSHSFPPGFKAKLESHQSAGITSLTMQPICLGQNPVYRGGLIAIVYWSYLQGHGPNPLDASYSTNIREVDTLSHIARESLPCKDLSRRTVP